MGVWQRSPVGREISLETYPELRTEDVIGSPYCVRDYVVDERFGGPEALAHARAELARRGLKLILDYVPNHVAPDHPWVAERPGLLHPRAGRRPSPTAATRTSRRGPTSSSSTRSRPSCARRSPRRWSAIADQCDGVRCDMAMLMVNEVFARTWELPAPAEEFWPPLIDHVKAGLPRLHVHRRGVLGHGVALQQQGFDYCYDKRLYDRLAHEGAESVRGHLQADRAYQERLLRFIENHDEPRAATALGERHRAAAVVMSTVPGARLYHDGQFEGRREHIPVFVDRAPDEPPDEDLRAFYARLLRAVRELSGEWRLCDCREPAARRVGVGRAPGRRQPQRHSRAWGRVRVPWTGDVVLEDRLSGERYERGEELWVGLEAWGAHLFHWSPG